VWLRTRPDGDTISQEVRDRLKDLSSYLFCNRFGEPFWEKEWRSENGYTMENQVSVPKHRGTQCSMPQFRG